jgi:protein-tyrosine phosphatase
LRAPSIDAVNPLPDEDDAKSAARARMVVDFDVLRHLGGRNFRDLGGRPANSGRRVRRQKIYRSAHLADVPAESPLNSLELTTLVTLQSRIEVSFLGPPKREILSRVRWEHIPMGDRWFTRDSLRIKPEPGREHLLLVTYFREEWGAFFKLLARREVYPLLFHCSAGRDRTGVGAAMLLELLGVGREAIVADFVESNAVFPRMPLTAAQLDPVFELVDRSGGIEALLGEVMGLERFEIEAIRNELLTGEPVESLPDDQAGK